MVNYKSNLNKIVVSHSDEDLTKINSYKNTTGELLRKRLALLKNGHKEGSHFLRTTLKTDSTNKLLSRSNANINETASIIILDCDKSILLDGSETEGAPDPNKIHQILISKGINHDLYGTFSYYVGNKGNRYRINLTTSQVYTKTQLPLIVNDIIKLINSELNGNKLANAKENSVFAQSWYFPRKPENSTIDHLYLEYLDGALFDISHISNITSPKSAIPNLNSNSPIELYNKNNCIKQLLCYYGYINKGGDKWLSPNSTSGIPGIIVKDNKIYCHHSDALNDGHWHTAFDLMRFREGLELNEAVKKISPSSTQNKSNSPPTSNTAAKDIKFNPYIPFNNELLPVEKVPLEHLPDKMADFIREQSLIRGCPQDFILVSLLARIGVIFAGKVNVQLTRNTDWIAAPNFFWAMVGKSSAGKSNALSSTKKYLVTLSNQAKQEYKLAYSEFKTKKDTLELQISTAQKKINSIIKSSSNEDIQSKEAEITVLKREMAELEQSKPVLKRYTISKVTIEKLIKILEENPIGIMLEIDELGATFIRLARDEHAEERGLYLTGYNGDQDYSYDTHKHGHIFIKRVVLSILGGIQPSKLKRFLFEALNGKHDDGMLQRFQGIVYPDQYDGMANDRSLSISLDLYIQNTFINLNQIQENIILKFDNEAQSCFDAVREEITIGARKQNYPLDAHLGKTIDFIAGLSIYLCLLDNKGELPDSNKITLRYTTQAIKLGEYFLSHAKRVYGLVYKDNLPSRTLSEKMVTMVVNAPNNRYYDNNTGLYSYTRSDIRSKGWTNLYTTKERLEAITTLIEMGHISEQIGGRYYINPEHLKD